MEGPEAPQALLKAFERLLKALEASGGPRKRYLKVLQEGLKEGSKAYFPVCVGLGSPWFPMVRGCGICVIEQNGKYQILEGALKRL